MARTVVVTGAESGIGAACAIAFGHAGDRVGIFYNKDATLAEHTAEAVRNAGGDAQIVECHVNDEASVDDAYARIEGVWPPADVLVNSAGMNMSGVPVRDMKLDQWKRMIDTDLTGAFLTSRRFLTARGAASGAATILHVSSIHAFAVRKGGADYCSAKGGLTRFVQTLAIEEASRGVTVNAIEPGMILTPMNSKAMEDEMYRKSLEENIPAGRAGKADEVADLAVFLASEKARYITGAHIVIDGGLSLMQALGA